MSQAPQAPNDRQKPAPSLLQSAQKIPKLASMCFSASDFAECDRERLKWYTYSKCGSGIFSVRAHLEIHPGNNIYWNYTGPAGARRGSPV